VQNSFRNAGKDVADSKREMEKIDMLKNMPIRMISQETDADNRAIEKEG
jgi:hypothetical protein